ncbi:MAG: cyclic nucleotide-binding domain-containing protein [Chloroflexi bacterium]|nr:cyclic nucleotide-binding domain-containing protein [Chloroflexota bacterium]
MTTVRRVAEIRPIPVMIYTDSARYAGTIRSNHFRFSDALNAVDQAFVMLHEARIRPFHSAGDEEVSAAWVLIRKDTIVAALPWEPQAGVERSPLRQGLQVARVQLLATIEAWPFTIVGDLHLAPGVELLQYIHDPHHQFMPVSDTTVLYHPSPALGFKAPFLVVNRHRVEAVMQASAIGQRAAADPDVVQPKVVDAQLSGARAAELLATSVAFKGVQMLALQQVCTEFCDGRRISRKVCRAGAEVFHQGDLGDSLYIVESGKLGVYVADLRSNAEQHLSDFGPGDFFGEMAVLGEGRRTATVRALTDASLMAMQEEAVKRLLQRFPLVASKMLAVMAQRRAELNAAVASGPRHRT